MFEGITATSHGMFNTIFAPILQMHPVIIIAVIAAVNTFIITLMYKFHNNFNVQVSYRSEQNERNER